MRELSDTYVTCSAPFFSALQTVLRPVQDDLVALGIGTA